MNRIRVLVVDDRPDSTLGMVSLLEALGYDARGSTSQRGALQLAGEWLPHVILLDLAMPGMDGFEVARRLREMDGLAKTRIIAWTASDDRESTRKAGFAGHLVKPVDVKMLRASLDGAGG
jgi:CheY-like chemotaxis protein